MPFGIRSVVGVLFMGGGILGFLPILGFWMFPLGIAFVALDIPWTRHRIEAWMVKLKAKAEVRGPPGPQFERRDADEDVRAP